VFLRGETDVQRTLGVRSKVRRNLVEKMLLRCVHHAQATEEGKYSCFITLLLFPKMCFNVFCLRVFVQQDVWNGDEIALLVNLLYSGIGFYQHLIMRLQEEFQLDLDGVAEFPMYKCNYGLLCHVHGKRKNLVVCVIFFFFLSSLFDCTYVDSFERR
jgi:hypothetical protein